VSTKAVIRTVVFAPSTNFANALTAQLDGVTYDGLPSDYTATAAAITQVGP
jgi:hypothetical protein